MVNIQGFTVNKRIGLLKIKHFVPLFATLACSIITVIVYCAVNSEREFVDFAAALGGAFVALVIPLYTLLFKKDLPWFICVLVCVNIVFATDLGTTLKVYDKLLWWDTFVHGIFGFLATSIFFWGLSQSKRITLGPWAILLLSIAVAMAFGALWEVCEYLADLIFDGDTQRVADSIAAGKSPVADTMEDLMITLGGGALFAALFAVDCLCSHKLFRALGLVRRNADGADAQEPEINSFSDSAAPTEPHQPLDKK